MLAPAVLVIAPAEFTVNREAVLLPVSNVEESSKTVTSPTELKVRDPKLNTSPAVVPSMTLVPAKFALSVTVTFALVVLIMSATELRLRF